MFRQFKELCSLVPVSKYRVLIIIVLNIVEAFFLVSGLALLYPLIKYLQLGPTSFWEYLLSGEGRMLHMFFQALHIPVTFVSLIVIAVGPLLLLQLAKYIKDVLTTYLEQGITFEIRKKLLNRVLRADNDFFISVKQGVITNTLTMDALYAGLNMKYLVGMYSSMFIAGIYIVVLTTISFTLLIVSMALLIWLPLIVKRRGDTLKATGRKISEGNAKLQAILSEKIKGIKKIKIMGMVECETNLFLAEARIMEQSLIYTGKTNALIKAILEPVSFILLLVIVYISIEWLKMDFGIVILFIYTIVRFKEQITNIIMNRNQVNIYNANLHSVKKLFDTAEGFYKVAAGRVPFTQMTRGISINNVSLSFPDEILFTNLSVEIKANTTTALIGQSGSGKTTLIDLIMRFRDVDSGSVFIDGVDIRELDLESYRKKIGYVSQEHVLFNGTILDNITYGIHEYTTEQIIHACKLAHAHEFIQKMENGYNTHIGEAGSKLSVGQKQRLALANMFLKDPDIIILDEPTSALDNESEKIITGTIAELKGRKTIIVIAHRLSTVKDADHIIVLNNGQVVEQGTKSELMHTDGFFMKLLKLQEINTHGA